MVCGLSILRPIQIAAQCTQQFEYQITTCASFGLIWFRQMHSSWLCRCVHASGHLAISVQHNENTMVNIEWMQLGSAQAQLASHVLCKLQNTMW